jgi:D-aspartate ligase
MAVAINPERKAVFRVTRTVSRKHRKLGALVLDGDYRALGVVRSLGRHGIPVWILHHGDQLLATFSRYTRRTLRWPSREEEEMVDFLANLADREALRNWVLFPSDDSGAAMVARHHQMLSQHFQLNTPPWEVLRWSYDKRLTYQLADEAMVDHPWTSYPANRDDVAAMKCEFPVILKPAYHNCFNRFTASKAWRVNSRDQLLALYDEARTLVPPDNLMIQEIIPGNGESQFSFAALCRDGQPLAALTARRTRQFPVDFGRASTFVETVEDSATVEAATRLLKAMRYTGIAEVEFKRDPRNGKLKLLDVNPRVWGWQSLCAVAGVDYPYLLWLMTTGEDVPQTKPAVGVRWMRFSTDVSTAIREILRGRLSLWQYLRSIRPPLAPAIYAADDPLPGLLEIPLLAFLTGKRMLNGSGMV